MPSSRRLTIYGALTLAALVTAVTIGRGIFVPYVTDASGYISAGRLWHDGRVVRPASIPLWASWPNAAAVAAPLAYQPGPIAGTTISTYPPGLPILIAAARWIGGPLAGYCVAPIMAGALVCAAFALARRLGGDGAGLLAAGLVATSPVVLLNAVHPMSDVPAAACWVGALALTLRGTTSAAVAAGALVALSVLIRPNLAPLAVVPAAVLLVARAGSPSWRPALAFCAAAAVGPALLLWTQAAVDGGALTSSYGAWWELFGAANFGANLRLYPRLLAQSATLLPLAGLALPALGRRLGFSRGQHVLGLAAVALAALNFLLLAFYTPFDHWPFLRFLLPGVVMLFVLFAAALAAVVRRSGGRWWVVALAACLAMTPALKGVPLSRYALDDWRAQARIRLMGRYLREAWPANAVALAFAHSGALAHYTGRDVVRLDLIAPEALDGVVADLQRHGLHPFFVLDRELEVAPFQQRFAESMFGRLDWAPRAVFTTVATIACFDPADRAAYHAGARWPVDQLR